MPRAFLFVLDSLGVGGAPDARRFGDEGANTLAHVAAACAAGRADRPGARAGPLHVPHMASLGLGRAAAAAAGADPLGGGAVLLPGSFHGAATEVSSGKDTPSGHWEIAGLPVPFEWGYFPRTVPALPADLTQALLREAGLPGILGDRHASGTDVIRDFGEEHVRTGKPILYTSADSVLQIAAHEASFGLERLYALCRTARRLVDPLKIGRVIARPFTGAGAGTFRRTAGRRDFAVPPPKPTLLDRVEDSGGTVFGIGKVGDIFAGAGVTQRREAAGNAALFDAALGAMGDARSGDLVFANFVDFDTLHGHRRDVAGYAEALEAFDRRLPKAFGRLDEGDLLLLTADHGCDPTWGGSDHTRERVPVIGLIPGAAGGGIGLRSSFADIGATLAAHLRCAAGAFGRSFLGEIRA